MTIVPCTRPWSRWNAADAPAGSPPHGHAGVSRCPVPCATSPTVPPGTTSPSVACSHAVHVRGDGSVWSANGTSAPSPTPRGTCALDDLRARVETLGALPGGSRVTWEPGGQLELSSPPAAGVAGGHRPAWPPTCRVVDGGPARRRHRAGRRCGVDPLRPPAPPAAGSPLRRHGGLLRRRRARGAGDDDPHRVGAGQPGPRRRRGRAVDRRWRLAHVLGPTLVAAFANSPLARRPADRLVLDPPGRPGRHRPHPHRARRRAGAGRGGLGRLRPRRPGHAHPRDGERFVAHARPAHLRRLAGRRPRAGLARPSTTSTTT